MAHYVIGARQPRMWHVIDAKDQIIGRLAPQIAKLLMGKHKPTYTAHQDRGDYVVVINAAQAVFTGDKMKNKVYRWHTGWMGGLKELTARQMHERAPERLLEHAVKGMMPPNKLRYDRMFRLRVFADDKHPHAAQTTASAEYAPEYLTTFAPKSFTPPPKVVTGVLVADVFPGASDKQLEELSKGLVFEKPEESAARFKAFAEGKYDAEAEDAADAVAVPAHNSRRIQKERRAAAARELQ